MRIIFNNCIFNLERLNLIKIYSEDNKIIVDF